MIQNFFSTRISKERFEFLDKEIKKLFPREVDVRYYEPPVKTDDNTKSKGAKGKLYSKYKSMSQELGRYLEEFGPREFKRKSLDEDVTPGSY